MGAGPVLILEVLAAHRCGLSFMYIMGETNLKYIENIIASRPSLKKYLIFICNFLISLQHFCIDC